MQRLILFLCLVMNCQSLMASAVPVVKVILPKVFSGNEIEVKKAKIDVYAHTSKKDYRYKSENSLCPGPMDSKFKIQLAYFNAKKETESKIIGLPFDKETIALTNDGSVWALSQLDLQITVNGKPIEPEIVEDTKFSRVWMIWRQEFPANKIVDVSYNYQFFGWGGDDCLPKQNNLYYLGFLLAPLKNQVIDTNTTVSIHFTDTLEQDYFMGLPETDYSDKKKVSWTFKNNEVPDHLAFAYSDGDKAALSSFLKKYANINLQNENQETLNTTLLDFGSIKLSEDELGSLIDNPEILELLDGTIHK